MREPGRGATMRAMTKPTLYGEGDWDSPFVFTTFVALREKGVDFDMKVLSLDAKEHRRPEFVAQTITAKVPALEHDGFFLAESLAIVEYVEEGFPGPRVYPADIRDRARARQILSWLRSDLHALKSERSTRTMFFDHATAPLSDAARADVDKLFRVVNTLRGDRPFVFGTWSIADADLAFALHRLILNGDEVPAPMRAWAEAQWKRPSVAAYVDHPRGS